MTAVEELLSLAERRDRAGFRDVVAQVAAEAASVDGVVALLADVQREVGRRWAADAWSVADEHVATGMVDLALANLAVPDRPGHGRGGGEPTGHVVLTCVEGEWHVVPARMVSEQLRARGWEVTFLGASLPAAHLRRFAVRADPMAVAVSCSVPVFLPGARRCVQAAHAAGVPVIAGGAAFGADERRAVAIGADGWAADASGADRVLRQWVLDRPSGADAVVDDRAPLALGAIRADVVAAAIPVLVGALGEGARRGESPPSAWAEQLLDWVLQLVESALAAHDDRVVEEAVPWLVDVLVARQYPHTSVAAAVAALVTALPPVHAGARRLLTDAGRLAGGPPP